MSNNNETIFRDICLGYSCEKNDLGFFYIKHINYEDHAYLEDIRKECYEECKKRGLPTIEESLKNLEEEGLWGEKKEKELKKQEDWINSLLKTKKNTYLKSKIDQIDKQIKECNFKLFSLKNERKLLLGNTCENHSDQKVSEEFIRIYFFKDKDLKEKYFNDEMFEELSSEEIIKLVSLYNSCANNFSDICIQKLVLEDFFTYYMPFCEDPMSFYGKPIINLTHNQLKLIIYSRYFKNILESSDKIPDEYRKDPEKLIDFVNANEKAKEKLSSKEGQATSLVGATQEDYAYLNVNEKNSDALKLSEEAKKKGGSLNMKDLMNLMGHD